jgi:hypothetical protein
VETFEMPWGAKLIPVDELDRLVAQRRRQAARARHPPAPVGRRPIISPEIVEQIKARRAAGESYRRIAAELTDQGVPTAHDGVRWWPSTVRAAIERKTR